jgi:PAS domain S-box-containing protein
MATLENPPETRAAARAAGAADILTRFLSAAGPAAAPALDTFGVAVLEADDTGASGLATTTRFPREALEEQLSIPDFTSLTEVSLGGTRFRMEPAGPDAWILMPAQAASPETLALARAACRIARLEKEGGELRSFQRALVDGICEGILAADGSGAVTFLSESAARFLGVAAREALGRPAIEIVRTPKPGEDLIALGLAGRVEEVEMTILGAGDRAISAGVRLEPLRGARGRIEGVLVVLRDLEQSKRLEEQARARDRMTSLGELTAAVAHEVRNPLTAIAASAQILRRRLSSDETQAALLDVIVEETTRLNRIVESMLQFAWQPRPRLVLAESPPIIERVLLLVAEKAGSAGVRLARDIAPGLPAVYADPDQIEQVLLNLAQNAVQAMSGGGDLTISAEVVEERAPSRRIVGRRAGDPFRPTEPAPVLRFVEITVADTGCGIRDEDLPRVFDPFFTTRRDGTGLGLSISQGIVQAHDGYLRLASRVGTGTRVTLGLPVERRRGERRSR